VERILEAKAGLGQGKRTNFAIALSDLHLGYDKADKEAFKVFLRHIRNSEYVDHLLLVGDVLDMWRRNNMKLVKENEDILEMLHDLKTNGNVGTIHYIVGNHDFTIQSEFPNLNKLFTFYSGSSTEPVWVELPIHSEGGELTDKTFKFMHGHQLGAGKADSIIPMYDGVCAALCKQGDLRGRIASALWDLRYAFPVVFLILTAPAFLYLGVIWAIALGLLAAGSFVAIYGIGKRRKEKSGLGFNEQVYELIEALPLRTKRRIIQYLKAPPHKRRQFTKVSASDIDKAYNRVKDHIVDIDRESAHTIINDVAKTLPTRLGFDVVLDALNPNEHQVIGHTHEAEQGAKLTNLGCWVKGSPYNYLVINNEGQHDLKVWPWKELSRWQYLKRKMRRQKTESGYGRVIKHAD
jgi:predicted phosphodiesterase